MSTHSSADETEVSSRILGIARRIVAMTHELDAEHDIRLSSYEGDVGDNRLNMNKTVRIDKNVLCIGLVCKPDKFTLPVHIEVIATLKENGMFEIECLGAFLPHGGDEGAFVSEATQKILAYMKEWRLGMR